MSTRPVSQPPAVPDDGVSRGRSLARGLGVVTGVLAAAVVFTLLVPILQGYPLRVVAADPGVLGWHLTNPGVAAAGALVWLGGVLAATWASVRFWSRGRVPVRRLTLTVVASLAAVLASYVLLHFSIGVGVQGFGMWPDLPPPPGPIGASLITALLLAVFVGLPVWAAVDASTWPDRAFGSAGRGPRLLWVTAPVVALIVGLGWAAAAVYFGAVRPRVAASTREQRR